MKKVIEKIDDFGRGITFVNNKITFIPKCIPGDEVEFVIIDEHSKYFTGCIKKLVKPSMNRLEAKCPFYNECGGCSLQNLSYIDTLDFKKEKVNSLFKRNGLNVKNVSVVANSKPYNYRNKVSLKISKGIIGFYKENTHDIVAINECVIANEEINKAIRLLPLLNIVNANITIRANYLKETLIIIETKEKIDRIPEVFGTELNLKGIVLNNKVIYGKGFLEEKINNIKYEVSYDSFFQVNPFVASLLFKKVESYIEPYDTVFDLYCGVGALSLVESKKAKKVIGIEIIKNAVINATKNKMINKVNNADFILSDLSKGINVIERPTCVVIDPPRSGIDKAAMNWIIKEKPSKIIYVSCDPNTLVRDLKMLNGYEITELTIFDMFSYTYHCETITVLNKKVF